MPHLEVEVVVVGVRSEANFFDDRFSGLGFELLFLFLSFVEELVVIDDAHDRRIGIGGNLDQVEFHLMGPFEGFAGGIDVAGFYGIADRFVDFFDIVADEADFRNPDLFIDAEFELRAVVVVAVSSTGGSSFGQMKGCLVNKSNNGRFVSKIRIF